MSEPSELPVARGPPASGVPLRCERPGGNPVFQSIGAVSADPNCWLECTGVSDEFQARSRGCAAPIRILAEPRVGWFASSAPRCQATVIGLCRLLARPTRTRLIPPFS